MEPDTNALVSSALPGTAGSFSHHHPQSTHRRLTRAPAQCFHMQMRTIAVASLLLIIGPVIADTTTAEKVTRLSVDCSKQIGTIRALHGGNGGVLSDGGLTDLSAYFREMQMPLVRLHDCHWPNPDVVDMHVVFPNRRADPNDPGSYDFGRTDQYISAIRATGAKIVYR